MAGGSPSPRGAPPYIIVVAATGAAPVNAARHPAFRKHVVRAARRMPPPPPVSQRHWPEASKEEKVHDREERLATRATCTHRFVVVVVVVGLRARAHSLALALAGPRPAGAVGVVVLALLGAHRGRRPQRGGERRRREHEPEDPWGRPRPAAGAAAAAEHAVGLWLLLSRLARGLSQLGSDQSATSKTVQDCCEAKLFNWASHIIYGGFPF